MGMLSRLEKKEPPTAAATVEAAHGEMASDAEKGPAQHAEDGGSQAPPYNVVAAPETERSLMRKLDTHFTPLVAWLCECFDRLGMGPD